MGPLSTTEQFWKTKDSGFVAPDWEAIAAQVDSQFEETERDAVWTEVARHWLERTRERLGQDEYTLRASANFFLLSLADDGKASEVLVFLERCLKTIRSVLFFAADVPVFV